MSTEIAANMSHQPQAFSFSLEGVLLSSLENKQAPCNTDIPTHHMGQQGHQSICIYCVCGRRTRNVSTIFGVKVKAKGHTPMGLRQKFNVILVSPFFATTDLKNPPYLWQNLLLLSKKKFFPKKKKPVDLKKKNAFFSPSYYFHAS